MSTTLDENLNIIAENENIEIELLDGDLNIIQKLDDEPNDVGGLTAQELKAEFDKAGNIIQKYLNEKLVPKVIEEEATNAAREAAELARQTAEASRVSAEEQRVKAEQGRADAEVSRASAEQNRGANETARALAEQNRATAESQRVAAEETRAKNETDRKEAEQKRALAESNRSTAENDRVKAETARVSAEQGRANAETQRVAVEETRAKNEKTRAQAEQDRVTAEGGRVTAEEARAKAELARVDGEANRNAWSEYSSSITYKPGNKVAYDGCSYVNIKECKGITPGSSETYWTMIAGRGKAGADATPRRWWYIDQRGEGQAAGEVWHLTALRGTEEPTLDTVQRNDIVISAVDGAIMYVSSTYNGSIFTDGLPRVALGQVNGYLEEYPAKPVVTVGFTEDCDFVCDGTDDHVEIMAALKSLPERGGQIYFKAGTYSLGASVQPRNDDNSAWKLGDIELVCGYKERATFVRAYAPLIGLWDGMFCFYDAQRVTVRNLIFKSDLSVYKNDTIALECFGIAEQMTVDNCDFSGHAFAMQVSGTGKFCVSNCRFNGNGWGVYMTYGEVVGCRFTKNTVGVQVWQSGVGTFVRDNVFTDNATGVMVDGTSVTVSGNAIRSETGQVPVELGDTDLNALVMGNVFVGVDATASDGNTVLGNTFIAE